MATEVPVSNIGRWVSESKLEATQKNPCDFAQRLIGRLRDIANSLLAQLEIGVGDDIASRQRWSTDRHEFNGLAWLACPGFGDRPIESWAKTGIVAVPVARALDRAQREVECVSGYPLQIDQNFDDMRESLERFVAATQSGGVKALTSYTEAPQTNVAPQDTATLDERAAAVKVMHPEWTDQQIADHLGCERTSLYKDNMKRYKAAKAALELNREEFRPDGAAPTDRRRRTKAGRANYE